MAIKAPHIHADIKNMINLLAQQGTEEWKLFGNNSKHVPAEWKPEIALIVHGILSQRQGIVFKTKKEEILGRGLLESVRQQAEMIPSAKGLNRLEKINKKQLAATLTSYTGQLYKAGEDTGFGVHGAVKVWKEIVKAKHESFETMTKDMTEENKRKHFYFYGTTFELEALNAVVTKARLMEKRANYESRVKLIVFIGLLILAASILVYSKKKIYRFARTQFRKIMDTWRRFRGRPAIYNTLNKLESSGRVSSPRSNKEMSIDEALRAIEMGNGFRTRSTSPSYSRTSSYKGSRAGSSSPVTKKSPKQKFKWIEFHVEKPGFPQKTTSRR
jgi:hypothetical protein